MARRHRMGAAIVAATAMLGSNLVVANAAPEQTPGWNHIPAEELNVMQPSVTAASEVQTTPGSAFNYNFSARPGFANNENGYAMQHWNTVEVCQDPSAPFDRAPQKGDFTPSIFDNFRQSSPNCWIGTAGNAWTPQDGAVKNVSGFRYANEPRLGAIPSVAAYDEPQEITASIPARVLDNANEGTLDQGTLKLTSGRLMQSLTGKVAEPKVEFVRNNLDGSCVFHATQSFHYEDQPNFGFYFNNAVIFADPAASDNPRVRDYYRSLPYQARQHVPTLLEGTVTTAGETYQLTPFVETFRNGVESKRSLAKIDIPHSDNEVFTSDQWVPAGQTMDYDLTLTQPCGPQANGTTFISRTGNNFYAADLQIFAGMARPPEAVSAQGTQRIVVKKEPTEEVTTTETTTETATETTTVTATPPTVTETETPDPATVTETTTVTPDPVTTTATTTQTETTTVTSPTTVTESTTVTEPVETTVTTTETATETTTETTTLTPAPSTVTTTETEPAETTTVTEKPTPETVTETVTAEPSTQTSTTTVTEETTVTEPFEPNKGTEEPGVPVESTSTSPSAPAEDPENPDDPTPNEVTGSSIRPTVPAWAIPLIPLVYVATHGFHIPGISSSEPPAPAADIPATDPQAPSDVKAPLRPAEDDSSEYPVTGAAASAPQPEGTRALANTGAGVTGIALGGIAAMILGVVLVAAQKKRS